MICYLLKLTVSILSAEANQVVLSAQRCSSSAQAPQPVLGRSYRMNCFLQFQMMGDCTPHAWWHSTFTSSPAVENLGSRDAGIHIWSNSAWSKNPEWRALILGFSLSQHLASFPSFCPLSAPPDLVVYVPPCHGPQIVTALLLRKSFTCLQVIVRHNPCLLLFPPLFTQVDSMVPPPDYQEVKHTTVFLFPVSYWTSKIQGCLSTATWWAFVNIMVLPYLYHSSSKSWSIQYMIPQDGYTASA